MLESCPDFGDLIGGRAIEPLAGDSRECALNVPKIFRRFHGRLVAFPVLSQVLKSGTPEQRCNAACSITVSLRKRGFLWFISSRNGFLHESIQKFRCDKPAPEKS